MKTVFFIVLCIIITIADIQGQNSSTYSRYGLGDIEYSYSARRAGMGQLGISVADEDFINSLNPAGWYSLNRTRIELGLYYNGMFLSGNDSKGYFAETEFSGFTVAFPISNLYGISAAAGLIPFTNVSYLVEESGSTTGSDYTITYEGSGGLTKAFIGTSYKLPFNLVIGASFDYYFGNQYYKSGIEFTNSSFLSSMYEDKNTPNGFGGTFGFISPNISEIFNSQSITDLRFGGSVNYFSKLDLKILSTSSTSNIIDTLSFQKSEIEIPPRAMVGLNIVFNNTHLLSLDYLIHPWQDYKVGGVKQLNLRNASKISAGFEYRPLRELGSTFWEQIIWRAGLSFEETQYKILNEEINQYSVAGGFSIPISPANTLDFGLQYSIRGTTESNLIKENTFRLIIGISFGETWFIRPDDNF